MTGENGWLGIEPDLPDPGVTPDLPPDVSGYECHPHFTRQIADEGWRSSPHPNRWERDAEVGGEVWRLELRNPGPRHWIVSAWHEGRLLWWRRTRMLRTAFEIAATADRPRPEVVASRA